MTYCIAHGTLLNAFWQPGEEGSLRENGYMYIWMSPFTVHLKLSHIFTWLYPKAKFKVFKN